MMKFVCGVYRYDANKQLTGFTNYETLIEGLEAFNRAEGIVELREYPNFDKKPLHILQELVVKGL